MNADPIADLTAAVAAAGDHAEGVNVLVVTPREDVARLVAPSLARRLYPDRTFGGVLAAEWLGAEGGWSVIVRDLGPVAPIR